MHQAKCNSTVDKILFSYLDKPLEPLSCVSLNFCGLKIIELILFNILSQKTFYNKILI